MVILLSHRVHAQHGTEIAAVAAREHIAAELLPLPADPTGRLAEADCARVEAAFFSEDIFPDYLDVFETEPLPADSPLWDMPNVLVSPHNATASAGSEARIQAIFLENLKRWARGEALLNEVQV